ncbi:MAG TPA: hypothetical protein VFC41_00595 [Anaerovoracaceae bacterium]|nr:hypothetical protein [Anaerovoracaceae bacterium]
MNESVMLIPLLCPKCKWPIDADENEVAWVCPDCRQGIFLNDSGQLMEIQVNYVENIPSGTPGNPFWAMDINIKIERETFRRDETDEMNNFWEAPRKIFIPAYQLWLDEIIKRAIDHLLNPPWMEPGLAVDFKPVVLPVEDLPAYIDFVLLQMEANRQDYLKKLNYEIQLGELQLWILPD